MSHPHVFLPSFSTSSSRTNCTNIRELLLWAIPIVFLQIILWQRQSAQVRDRQAPGDIVSHLSAFRMERNSSRLAMKKVSVHPRTTATFNGVPVVLHSDKETLVSKDLYSRVHCIGETYGPHVGSRKTKIDSPWLSRSCHFMFLCFDLSLKDFVIYSNPAEKALREASDSVPGLDVSQSVALNRTNQMPDEPFSIAIGGINLKWTFNQNGVPLLKWFPRVRHEPAPTTFYMLPPEVVLLPFHSMAGFNPGHLVWDDWLPIFSLLHIFQMDNTEEFSPLLVRYVIDGLWASCDWKPGKSRECAKMHSKFGPLITNSSIHTNRDPVLKFAAGGSAQSNLVCARQGIAGLGALTDHGVSKGHGFSRADYELSHNVGRGRLFRQFRNFMVRNLGVTVSDSPWSGPRKPYEIVFSTASSGKRGRSFYFKEHIALLTGENFTSSLPYPIEVRSHRMASFSLFDQVNLVRSAAIFVTGCGGGAVTATFVPPGSALFVFCTSEGGIENNRFTGHPARLDWDYLNSLAYTRVHWFPSESIESESDLQAFLKVVRHELSIIERDFSRFESD